MLKVKNFMSSLLSDKNNIDMGDNVKFVNEFVNFVFNDTEHVELNADDSSLRKAALQIHYYLKNQCTHLLFEYFADMLIKCKMLMSR